MSTPIDAYLTAIENAAARKTLGALRAQLRKLLPTAVETLSYGMPAYRLPNGKVAAGFAFFKQHCGYYPHSGRIVPKLRAELVGYETTTGGVTFPPDKPLPAAAVKALVKARLEEIASTAATKKKAKKPAKKKAKKKTTKTAAKRKPAKQTARRAKR
jgi:uncharacterized protein YdhG (YjbR/CyaY superfamily)